MANEKLLHPSVATAFYGNFSQIYSVQDNIIPYILNGENVVLSAGTGSGKTEAVMAPLVSRYFKRIIETDSLTILYIAPTKALVNDLERRLYSNLRKLDFRVGIRHGDQDDMKLGMIPHILITTPESLDVMLFRGDKALERVHAIVLDEIHLLYNTQRGLHVSILLNRVKQKLDHSLQWVAISATIYNLAYIRDFFFGISEVAVFLENSTKREIDPQIRILKSIDQLKELLIKIFASRYERGKFLIFANSRRECEQIATVLNEIESLSGLVCTHYSSLSVEMREEVESFFNS